jgi:hypothetical protein
MVLEVYDAKVTAEGAGELQKALPECTIIHLTPVAPSP